jgi:hypothetical protein
LEGFLALQVPLVASFLVLLLSLLYCHRTTDLLAADKLKHETEIRNRSPAFHPISGVASDTYPAGDIAGGALEIASRL